MGADVSASRSRAVPAATAQVLSAAGEVAGAGFLVAADVLVTCAHVVLQAGAGPDGCVELAFPQAPESPRVGGRVLAEAWRDPSGPDVAVIRLDAAPPGTAVLPLGAARGSRGHRMRSFGFPPQAPPEGHNGYAVAGDILSPGAQRNGPVLQLSGANDLAAGFSGAPVVDEITGLAVGMVTAIAAPDRHVKGLNIAYATPSEVLRDVWPTLVAEDMCPYLDLAPFTAEHARWFHGRQAAVDKVLAVLAGRRRAALLLGPSGSGKSSLVQAGVVPALAGGGLPGSDRWLPVVLRPAAGVWAGFEVEGLPGAGADGIAAAVERRLSDTPSANRVLLVVDQFEELLASSTGEAPERRAAFLRELTDAIRSSADLGVVLVMRDDFYPRLAAVAPDLLEAAAPGLVNIPSALARRDLRAMVTLPAREVGLHFDEGLAERIVSDVLALGAVAGSADTAPATVLPLLEVTLTQLWERRNGDGFLTHEAYQTIGEVSGSVAEWCDRAVRALPADSVQIARRMLTALVRPADPDRRIPAVRQQIPVQVLTDLAQVPAAAAEGEPPTRAEDVLQTLVGHRVVTTLRRPELAEADTGQPVAELVHDALIREWDTLRTWVAEDRQFQDWLRRADERRVRWIRSHDPGDLLNGTDLADAARWARQRALPEDVAAFAAVSHKASARRQRRRRAAVALLAVFALIASGAAVTANVERSQAITQRRNAVARLVTAESARLLTSEPGLAKQLALVAYHLDSEIGTSPLLAVLGTPGVFDEQAAVTDLAESADERVLALATGDTVSLWSTAGRALGTVPVRGVRTLALSKDGRLLATAGPRERDIALWSLTAPAHARLVSRIAAGTGVLALAMSPDGSTLAAGTASTIRLWDTARPALPRSLATPSGTAGADSLAFSPARPLLAASGTDGRLRLLDVSAPKMRLLATLDGYHGEAPLSSSYTPAYHRIAFNPDGTLLAGPGDGDQIPLRIWDVRTPQRPRRVAAPDASLGVAAASQCAQELQSLAFSPDGHVLAADCGDEGTSAVELWQTYSMSQVAEVNTLSDPRGAQAGPVVFAPRGRTLLQATAAGVEQWDATDYYQLGAAGSYGHVPNGFNVAITFSPGPRRLLAVVGGDSGTVTDLTGQPPHSSVVQLPGGYIGAAAAAFSPDGKVFADSEHTDVSADRRLLVLRLRSVSRAGMPIVATVRDFDYGVHGLAFSGDSSLLAVADNNDDRHQQLTAKPSVKLFDVRAPARPHLLVSLPADAFQVALSPDGRLLAAATADTLLSWDVSDPRHPVKLATHVLTPGSNVTAGVFSPDGRTLAVGDDTGALRLWPIANNRITGTPTLIRPTGYRGSLPAISPDGRELVVSSASDDAASLQVWDISDPRKPVFQAGVPTSGSDLSYSNVAFSADGRLLAEAPGSSIDVWNLDPDANTEVVCASIGDVITRAQWSQYVPHEPYRPPCASAGSAAH